MVSWIIGLRIVPGRLYDHQETVCNLVVGRAKGKHCRFHAGKIFTFQLDLRTAWRLFIEGEHLRTLKYETTCVSSNRKFGARKVF
jgi:hypothetical protein